MIWFGLRDDAILVNSAVGRAWPTNLLRDPRFSFVVEDGYSWIGVRGRAEALTDQTAAQADIAGLNLKEFTIRSVRVYAPFDFERAMDLVADSDIDLRPLVSPPYSFDQAPETFRKAAEGTSVMRVGFKA